MSNGMTYEEAIDAVVSRDEAQREIAQHCTNLAGDVDQDELEERWAEFVDEHGDAPTYLGADVLGWLGY